MATNYREILRLAKLGYSQRSIAASAGGARSTVQRVLERAESNPHTLEELLALSDKGIQQALFPVSSISSTRKPPDYERVHRELAKNGVTLSLLWNEYCEECYASKELPLMYTQFCLHYREYAQQTKATMHLDHKPGEQMEVDWAGDTGKVTDPETGSQTPAYLFIAVLSCSGYAYVEAFGDQGQESWITGHVHAYRYFGGATRILTPDPPWKRGSHSQSYLPGDGGTLQHLYPASQSTSPKRLSAKKCYRQFYERFSKYADNSISIEIFLLIMFFFTPSIAILILTTGFTCGRKEH